MKKGTKTVLAAGAAVGAGALLKNQLTDNPSPVGSYGGTDIYRTPEEQFENLHDYPFAPHKLSCKQNYVSHTPNPLRGVLGQVSSGARLSPALKSVLHVPDGRTCGTSSGGSATVIVDGQAMDLITSRQIMA